MNNSLKTDEGFIALVSVILISLILTVVVFTVSFGGFSSRFNILDSEFKETSFFAARSCRDIALLKLSINDSYLPVGGGDDVLLSDPDDVLRCRIVSISVVGGEWVIETSAQFEKAETNLNTKAEKIGGSFSIISSYEVEDFN